VSPHPNKLLASLAANIFASSRVILNIVQLQHGDVLAGAEVMFEWLISRYFIGCESHFETSPWEDKRAKSPGARLPGRFPLPQEFLQLRPDTLTSGA
jgi:hypothetical protein